MAVIVRCECPTCGAPALVEVFWCAVAVGGELAEVAQRRCLRGRSPGKRPCKVVRCPLPSPADVSPTDQVDQAEPESARCLPAEPLPRVRLASGGSAPDSRPGRGGITVVLPDLDGLAD